MPLAVALQATESGHGVSVASATAESVHASLRDACSVEANRGLKGHG